SIQIERDVALVTIEPLRLALAAMTHVRILDRHAQFGGHTLADARLATARGVGLEILGADLRLRVGVAPLHIEPFLPRSGSRRAVPAFPGERGRFRRLNDAGADGSGPMAAWIHRHWPGVSSPQWFRC